MFTVKRAIARSLFVLFLFSTASAQENRAPIETPREPVASRPLVTATATAERVRFVSPGTVVRLRLEVYNEAGQKLFDTELHGGNVLDWHLQDGVGQRLSSGSYACVLTTKSLSGRLSQRVGLVRVEDKEATVAASGAAELSTAQQQAIGPVVGPVEGNAAFTVLQESEAEAITAVTHDGTDGQVARTRGALSFRVGDFFSGTDTEQMRLTEEGNLGIGTSEPQAKLDVAGAIRTTKGIEFADGTVQTTGLSGRKDKDGNLVPNVAGTGTQNRLAKWTDNAGTLEDSLLGETAGGVELRPAVAGVGVNPTLTNFANVAGFAQVSFYPAAGPNTNMSFSVVPRGLGAANNRAQFSIFNTDLAANPTNYEFAALRARGSDFVLGTGKSGTGVNRPFMFASGYLSDNTTNDGQFYLASNGNVGVGTSAPAQKLDVAGNINTSTQYHIGGARMLSAPGPNNLFVGASAGNANTGTDNSFFGRSAGLVNSSGSFNTFSGAFAGASNTTAGNNAFYGYNAGGANTTARDNSFFGSQAGSANTTGLSNSFFGSSAGTANTTSFQNSFFGAHAGTNNTSSNNSFFGASAGRDNTTGSLNSFFGLKAGSSNTTGSENSFFGVDAGNSNTTGSDNAFFGTSAGSQVTIGNENSFFGSEAGRFSTASINNSFFGFGAGFNSESSNNSFFGWKAGRITTGSNNAFFGLLAGNANTSAFQNSFFGAQAGESNTTGTNNSFFGYAAGSGNTTGSTLAFFGSLAGDNNTTGESNSFFGVAAGLQNSTGSNNTIIGRSADVGSGNLTFATAIGASATVSTSNTIALGRSDGSDSVRIPGALIVLGNALIAGNLSKGSGSFKIDHPLDPTNKYLYHSFVESPDMMNVYNGNSLTDARGLAVITLPNYFEALNRDFRYQLTVIGQFAQAIVFKKIDGNRFQIKTSKPRVEVSWQVTGVRRDAYAEAHRIPTEELKPERERGTYLHPDAFAPKRTVTTATVHQP